jgi:protein-tyrosine phosphatase
MEQEQLSRYIELEMGENVREMGGYPAEGGALTQAHRFLRSGTTFELTRRDLRFLRRYGVRRVVDLRGVEEAGVRPDPFSKRLGVAFLQEPLYNFDMHDPKLEHPRSEEDDEDRVLI